MTDCMSTDYHIWEEFCVTKLTMLHAISRTVTRL